MNIKSYLIDTHLLYWWMIQSPKLGKATIQKLRDSDILVSTASLWEMVLKNHKGKLSLPDEPLHYAISAQGFRILPITPSHLEALRGLGLPHEDPFDRLLLATAIAEDCILLTRDSALLSFFLPFVEPGLLRPSKFEGHCPMIRHGCRMALMAALNWSVECVKEES